MENGGWRWKERHKQGSKPDRFSDATTLSCLDVFYVLSFKNYFSVLVQKDPLELHFWTRLVSGYVVAIKKRIMDNDDGVDDISILSNADYSIGSLDSVATASTIFFSDNPKIPHIDSHITFDNCKYEALKPTRNKMKNSKKNKRKKILKSTNQMYYEEEHEEHAVSDIELHNLFSYIDACGDFNGIITLDEIDVAFRKYHHAENHYHEEEDARHLMKELEALIENANMTIDSWFNEYHSGHKGIILHESGEYIEMDYMKSNDLKRAVLGLQEKLFVNKNDQWDDDKLMIVQRYLDPSLDGEISAIEIKRGFKRLHLPAEASLVMELAGKPLRILDNYMSIYHLRVRDLYEQLGAKHRDKNSGVINCITIDLLREGIDKMVLKMNQRKMQKRIQKEKINHHHHQQQQQQQFSKVEVTHDSNAFNINAMYDDVSFDHRTVTPIYLRIKRERRKRSHRFEENRKKLIPVNLHHQTMDALRHVGFNKTFSKFQPNLGKPADRILAKNKNSRILMATTNPDKISHNKISDNNLETSTSIDSVTRQLPPIHRNVTKYNREKTKKLIAPTYSAGKSVVGERFDKFLKSHSNLYGSNLKYLDQVLKERFRTMNNNEH